MIPRPLRRLCGALVGTLARVWVRTLRVTVSGVEPDPRRRWVLAFQHGTQFALLGWAPRRDTAVLVSLSADGDLQAAALPRLGLVVRRGSSSRAGARGLLALIRTMRDGLDGAFAVDGPRGPRGVVKKGAVLAARRSGGILVPMGASARHALVLRRAWDHFLLPLPFTRVAIVLGDALEPDGDDPRAALEVAIDAANARAAHLLDAPMSVLEQRA